MIMVCGGSTFVVVRGTTILTIHAQPIGTGTILPIETIMWVSVSSKLIVPESKAVMF
jgi:hypothetical protein